MKSFIYPEMMVHVPLCTSKNPKNVLVVSTNTELLIKEIQKHSDVNFTVVECEMNTLGSLGDAEYDVVICEARKEGAFIAHISRLLKEDGQLVTTHPHLDEIEQNKEFIHLLGKFFKIVMPYNLGSGETALLASKEYHPTADIILQRADMLDNLEYYNCDFHISSFSMPKYIRKEYLCVIKN